MAADETVTWGEVCKNVSYRDGLYRVCKDKVPEYNGFQPPAQQLGSPSGDNPAPAADFDAQLAKSAKPIPPPPPADWQPEPEGVIEQFFGEVSFERLAVYGILGAVIWYFFLRKDSASAPAAQPPAGQLTGAGAGQTPGPGAQMTAAKTA